MKMSGRLPIPPFGPGSTAASRGFVAVLLCVAALAGVEHAAAQTESSESEIRLRALFAGMTVNETVYVVTPEVLVDHARFVSLESSTVELRQEGTGVPISVDLTAIRGVAVQRTHWLQGALWGLGGGLLAGSMFGLMIGSFECDTVELCKVREREGAVRWGTALGLVGGGIGFTFGRRAVYWKSIFP